MVTNRSKLNFKPETNILADYIIPTPERRFISDNLIDHLNKIKDSYMDKEDYTTDLNGTSIVKLSERSLSADSIEWDNILHKPTLDLKEVNEAIQALITSLYGTIQNGHIQLQVKLLLLTNCILELSI